MLPSIVVALALQGTPQPAATVSAADRQSAYGTFIEALELRERGKTEDALKTLQRAAEKDPRSPDIHAEIAKTLRDEGRFDEALAALATARKMAPERADLPILAGQIHQYQGQSGGGAAALKKAAEEYEEAAKLAPDDLGPLRDLTRVYGALRDVNGARGAWSRLLALDPLNLEGAIQVAQLAMAAGDIPSARKTLEDAAKLRPDNARIQALLGNLKVQSGDGNALENFQNAARLDEGDLASKLKAGDLLLSAKKPDEALKVASEVLAVDDKNRFALDLRARAFKDLGKIDEALEIAKRLALKDPSDLKSAFLVVTLLESKGSFTEAETQLQKLLTRDKKGEDPQDAMRNDRVFTAHVGIVRQQLGRFAEAAESFGQAAALGTERDPQLVNYRLEALLAAKDFETVEREARAARKEFPREMAADFAFAEASAAQSLGRLKEATKLVEEIVAEKPEDAERSLQAAEFFQRAKDWKSAEALYRSVLSKDATNARAAFGLGGLLERQKRYDEAEEQFRAVLKQLPRSAAALNYLGYMNANRNVRVKEALELIERALEIDPGNGAYLDSRGWALYRLSRFAEAEADTRKALESQRENAVVLGHMGHILDALRRSDEAADYWRRALKGEDEDGELDRADIERKLKSLTKPR